MLAQPVILAIIKNFTNKHWKGCGDKGALTVGGNVNWYGHYGEQYGGSLKKIKAELPYDPETPFHGTYPQKNVI